MCGMEQRPALLYSGRRGPEPDQLERWQHRILLQCRYPDRFLLLCLLLEHPTLSLAPWFYFFTTTEKDMSTEIKDSEPHMNFCSHITFTFLLVYNCRKQYHLEWSTLDIRHPANIN